MNSLKLRLLEWAVATFGENDLFDYSNVHEEIEPTKDPRIYLKKVTLFVKKKIGVDKSWLEKETASGWRDTLKELVGDHLKLHIRSSEGREIRYLSGLQKEDDKEAKHVDVPEEDSYNYQFNLDIIKLVDIKEKSHVSPRPRV